MQTVRSTWMEQEIPLVLQRATQRMGAALQRCAQDDPSPLDATFRDIVLVAGIDWQAWQAWQELLMRAYGACGGCIQARDGQRYLEISLAAFALSLCALEILDDVVDGDPPASGRQAPNVALALLGTSVELLGQLPLPLAHALQGYWGVMYRRCAAAQARDVAATIDARRTVEQALAVARGSGLVTQWAVEVGGLLAAASPGLLEPLAAFGRHLGTAEKLLHDLHDIWPSDRPSDGLRRPDCNLALVAASSNGPLPSEDAAKQRQGLYDSGLLHYMWAHVDLYHMQAAAALDRCALAGADTSPLQPLVGRACDLLLPQGEDAELHGSQDGLLPAINSQLFADLGCL